MDWMSFEIADNEAWRWLAALGVAVGTVVLVRALLAVVRSRLAKVAEHTETRADDVAIEILESTRWFFYVGLGVFLGSRLLELEESVRDVILLVETMVLLLQVGVWGTRAIRATVEAWQSRHGPDGAHGRSTMAAGIAFVGQLVLWTVVLLMALSNLGVEITTLIAGLGMGGIAAALAVQNILGDLFASLSIYFDRPFDLGDFIIVGDEMGTVDKIGLRSTRVRALGGEQLIFANKDLIESRIRNYKRMRERRVVVEIGVQYDTAADTLEQAPRLMREAVESAENARFDRAHFKGFGDSALMLELVYWVLGPDYDTFMDVQQTISFGLLRRFEDAGLRFAFPTRTIHLEPKDAAASAVTRSKSGDNGAAARSSRGEASSPQLQ